MWEQRVGLPLRFVYTTGAVARLAGRRRRRGSGRKGAVDASRRRPRVRPGQGRNKQRRTRLVVLVYKLVPSVTTTKRIDLESAASAAHGDLAAAVAVEVASVLIPDARNL